jgi:hypothetical protein
MYKTTAYYTAEQKEFMFKLLKTDKFLNKGLAEVARYLMDRGAEVVKQEINDGSIK